ncbi:hypothetical protein SCHPADRAFT_948037 [Schizopora paradoxa]|uniref:HTH CENPB-type domain-containing protein n=1 Tax=Schizopora paradoxa TaxID=27342 RepID=A0A0H2R3K3_9AGAM|nr:hypothetical protein SCHPADRAFT_948037 [Schizopora paradoxa]
MSSASYPPNVFELRFNPYAPFRSPSAATTMLSTPLPARHRSRLRDRERKEICEFARRHPGTVQDDIASLFDISRGTVSKILKQSDKWLQMEEEEEGDNSFRAKAAKFPEIEIGLEPWLMECCRDEMLITDNMIGSKAREIARSVGISDIEFKASPGWITNYKRRYGIRRGVLVGSSEACGVFDDSLPEPNLEDELAFFSELSQKYVDDFQDKIIEDTETAFLVDFATPDQEDAPSDGNEGVDACESVSAQEALRATKVVQDFIKSKSRNFCTVHELNVFQSIQNVIKMEVDSASE